MQLVKIKPVNKSNLLFLSIKFTVMPSPENQESGVMVAQLHNKAEDHNPYFLKFKANISKIGLFIINLIQGIQGIYYLSKQETYLPYKIILVWKMN